MNPLVSFVIPNYNRDQYLAECVESCLDQTYKNIEVILVDDGSTDHSKELYNYYTKDERVRVVYIPNSGIAKARNAGLKEAKGEYIAVLDSDDIANPDRIKLSLKKIKNADVVYSGYRQVSESGEDIGYVDPKQVTRENLKTDQVVPHVTIMAKKRCFDEHPYRDELKVNDDLALILDWFTAGYKFKKIEHDLLTAVRYHPNSVSQQRDKEVKKITTDLKKEFREIYEED